jgi:hypothetical protein
MKKRRRGPSARNAGPQGLTNGQFDLFILVEPLKTDAPSAGNRNVTEINMSEELMAEVAKE